MLEARIYHLEFPDLICLLPDADIDEEIFNELVLNNTNPLNYLTFDGLGINLTDNNLKFYQDGDYKIYALPYISSNVRNDFHEYPIEHERPIEFMLPSERFITRHLTMLFDENVRCKITIKWRSAEDNTELETTYEERLTNKTLTIELPDGVFRVWVWVVSSPLPNHFVKIESGFAGTMNVISRFTQHNLIEEITVLSDDLPINQFEASVVIDNVEFTKNDPLVLTSDKKYYGTFYVKKIDRVAANIYEITAQNSISFLDTVPLDVWQYDFEYGGANSQEILNRITQLTNVEIKGAYEEIISGIHKDGSCRAALCELGFELAQMVDASRSKSILFKQIPTQITSTILNNDRRIIGNSTFKKKEDVSKITIPFKDIMEPLGPPRTLKTKTINGEIGDIAVVTFEQPSWIVGEESSGFEVIQKTMYSRVIHLTSTKATIVYAEYETYESDFVHINPNAPFANEKKFSNFLTDCRERGQVRNKNAKKWAQSEGVVTAKIRLRDEKVGDLIQIETAWDGIITGIITKMNIVFGYEDIAEIEVLEWSL